MKKIARELRAEAWTALGEGGQYLKYVVANLLLALTGTAVMLSLGMLLGAGILMSGIAPFFAPGGQPEVGLLTDLSVMVPLLVSSLLFSILIIYPIGFLFWGQTAMAIAAMRRGLGVGHAFSGWGHGWKMGWVIMVEGTYVSLWSLLLIVPGIVKVFAYAMTRFVALDHPDWTANQCITESRRLMDGNKWRYFCLNLSFFGWWILLIVASSIPIGGNLAQWFFIPYLETAKAAFYEELLDRDADDATSGMKYNECVTVG